MNLPIVVFSQSTIHTHPAVVIADSCTKSTAENSPQPLLFTPVRVMLARKTTVPSGFRTLLNPKKRNIVFVTYFKRFMSSVGTYGFVAESHKQAEEVRV